MALTPVYRVSGNPIGLSVVATSHAAVTVSNYDNTQTNYAMFANTSATLIVYVTVAPSSASASTIPGDGTAGSFPILPNSSIVLSVPILNNSFSVTAIASGAGPTLLVVTPVSAV